MHSELQILISAAIAIALLHTLAGPDHYLPFIALSKTRKWSLGKTIFWTTACGIGHTLSSVLLGLGGAALGWNLSKINGLENIRGGVAGWLLLLFGLVYGIFGLWRAMQNKPHKHFDISDSDHIYVYEHKHGQAVLPAERHKVTPWVMFIIFLLGPCEPMIPLLYLPAAQHSWYGMMLLVIIYTLCTLVVMIGMVVLGYFGLTLIKADKLEKYIHAFGGLTLFICGAGMLLLGW